jgi:dinuclear metal center YbgI/SA1388 family protein
MSVKVKEIIDALERFAPLPLQESYDNAGLQVGLTEAEVSGALLCLDVTEEVVREAIDLGCNLIVSHHPVLFRGLKQVSDATQVQRIVRMAIQNDIAIYSAHTNLDKAEDGVNYQMAERLGLIDVAPVGDCGVIGYLSAPMDSRFFRLTSVDNFYKTEYEPPVYDNEVTLEEFCERFRKYAAAELKLYYTIDIIRYFIASMGTARIIILQGISGTGKTSLPYAFGKFVQKDTTVVSVQPSWRERTELYGYFNEFTKKYAETDFLRAVYESNYYRDPHFVILDEMNIARVEYYFAEMLSILEMPIQDEWKVDVVSAVWDNDPCLIERGSIHIPNNVWFVGTINNDDSTFAVADKVYDRAIPIDLDSRCESFECESDGPIAISTDHINRMFAEAKATYKISEESIQKIEILNAYIIKNFRLAFGNRIMKQIGDFVSCFIACGGTEIDAIDFIIAKKVFRKFESLSLGFMKDDLTKLNTFLDKTFGKNSLKICKEYVEFLKKNS